MYLEEFLRGINDHDGGDMMMMMITSSVTNFSQLSTAVSTLSFTWAKPFDSTPCNNVPNAA